MTFYFSQRNLFQLGVCLIIGLCLVFTSGFFVGVGMGRKHMPMGREESKKSPEPVTHTSVSTTESSKPDSEASLSVEPDSQEKVQRHSSERTIQADQQIARLEKAMLSEGLRQAPCHEGHTPNPLSTCQGEGTLDLVQTEPILRSSIHRPSSMVVGSHPKNNETFGGRPAASFRQSTEIPKRGERNQSMEPVFQSPSEEGPIYVVQVGAFRSTSEAEHWVAELQNHGYPAWIMGSKGGIRDKWSRVVLGRFTDSRSAHALADKWMNQEDLSAFVRKQDRAS